MTRYIYSPLGHREREVRLEEGLRPTPCIDYSEGQLEQTQADATMALDSMGRLLALLVKHGVIKFDDACDVAEQYRLEQRND